VFSELPTVLSAKLAELDSNQRHKDYLYICCMCLLIKMVELEGFGTLICGYETAVFSAVLYVHLDDNPIKYKVESDSKTLGAAFSLFFSFPYLIY